MREALFEQAQTQQHAAYQLRNFIAKMNKIYNEIQTPKTKINLICNHKNYLQIH